MAAFGDAISVIGQQGGGGGVSTDDEIQTIWRLCNQGNDQAAVEVPCPHVVNLEERESLETKALSAPQQLLDGLLQTFRVLRGEFLWLSLDFLAWDPDNYTLQLYKTLVYHNEFPIRLGCSYL